MGICVPCIEREQQLFTACVLSASPAVLYRRLESLTSCTRLVFFSQGWRVIHQRLPEAPKSRYFSLYVGISIMGLIIDSYVFYTKNAPFSFDTPFSFRPLCLTTKSADQRPQAQAGPTVVKINNNHFHLQTATTDGSTPHYNI